jgi:tetratricopeptide (TPR) repeat protein
MLEHQSAGLHWKRAYSRSFSEPIEQLSSRVSRHAEMLSRGTPSAVSYLPLDSLEVRDRWEIREVPPQEILQLFGEVALRNTVYLSGGREGNMELAEALFRHAGDFDSRDSNSRAGLAAALSAQSRFDKAEIQLAAFREDPEPSTRAIIHAADATRWHAVGLDEDSNATQREQLLVAAIRLYQTALEAQPNAVFALAGLGYSQLEARDYDAARKSLADARLAGEWDGYLTLSQGWVEKQLGFNAEASSFWKEVVRLGTEDEAKRAAALLDEINSN